MAGDLKQILAVHQNPSMAWQIKVLQQRHDGGLSATRMADQRDGLARFSDERNVREHRAPWFIVKTDLLELHPATNRRQLFCLRQIAPLRGKVDQAKI